MDAAAVDAHRQALLAFGLALQTGDMAAAAALLAPGVTFHSDGGQAFPAAGMPLVGPRRVLAALQALAKKNGPTDFVPVTAGGCAAVLLHTLDPKPRQAPRALWSVVLDPQGRIAHMTALLDPARIDPWRRS